jgi:transcriptional regulator with XRE-family HTH domain
MNDDDKVIDQSNSSSGAFATRLYLARTAVPLTQEALAERAGIQGGQSTIAHYEAGRREPGLDNLRRLVWALGESADYLLATRPGTDEDHRPEPAPSAPLELAVYYDGGRMTAVYKARAGATPKEAMQVALAEWPNVTRIEVTGGA